MTYYYDNKRDIHKEIGELVTLWMQCINQKGSMLAITNCCIPRFLRELNMYELTPPPNVLSCNKTLQYPCQNTKTHCTNIYWK